jgi:multiple sugar transport system permease protein
MSRSSVSLFAASRKKVDLLQRGLVMFAAFSIGIVIFYPFYWMVMASGLPEGSSLAKTTVLIPGSISLEAYATVLLQKPMLLWTANTLLVTVLSTVFVTPLALLAAYSMSRFRFRGRMAMIFVLLTQLLPATSVLIPLFLVFRAYGLLNNLLGVTIAYITFLMPQTIWILWGYLKTIPGDFEESAMVDGCTRFGAFLRVTVPIAVPGIVAAALFAFLESWNQYILAYALTSSTEKWVVSLGLYAFIGEYTVLVEQMMAASVMASIPALAVFVALQRYLRGGLALGGLKG